MNKLILLSVLLFAHMLMGKPHFVLIAAPGSGKGTFSQHMVQKYGYVQICPGDIYRQEIRLCTQLGKRIKPIVERGDYVDEETTCTLMRDYMLAALADNKPCILDGFPRSDYSFDFLHNFFKEHQLVNNVCFVQLLAHDHECIERVMARELCTACARVYNSVTASALKKGVCDQCGAVLGKRSADTRDIMVKRLAFFHSDIEPLMQRASLMYTTKYITTEVNVSDLLKVYDDFIIS